MKLVLSTGRLLEWTLHTVNTTKHLLVTDELLVGGLGEASISHVLHLYVVLAHGDGGGAALGRGHAAFALVLGLHALEFLFVELAVLLYLPLDLLAHLVADGVDHAALVLGQFDGAMGLDLVGQVEGLEGRLL